MNVAQTIFLGTGNALAYFGCDLNHVLCHRYDKNGYVVAQLKKT